MIRVARASLFLIVFLSGAAAAASAAPPSPAAAALHSLMQTEWLREMREDPLQASADGFHQYDGLWPDVSLATLAREDQEDRQTLKDLAAIGRNLLGGEDRISYDLLVYRYRMRVEDYGLEDQLMPVNELDGIQTLRTLTQSLRFENDGDYRNFLQRLQTFKPYMDETIALLKQGVARGMTEPQVVMTRVPHQIAAYVVADAAASPYYEPFEKMPDIIPAAEQARLRAAAKAAIADNVTPAYRQFEQYFDHDYLPHCRKSIAAQALPNGKAYYAFQVREYTTTDLTPAQIHAMGLRKVAQIHAQMEQVFKQVGFKGSYQDFVHYLRTDPRFYYKDPKQLLEAYRAAAMRVDPLLVNEFPIWILPRVPYGVRPIPASLAPDTYPAYSDPPAGDGSVAGYVSVNLYKPESRPKYEIQVLVCHEGRPGHQLQIPIAMELRNLPDFRRFDYYSSYGEGWALYTETLCDEMGLYDDAYSRFGYLDFQMWRAVRLVVDTGLHSEGWTRAQAVRYFEDNSALSEQNIDTEVDRYIAWPGQALSYMIGELDIQRLRQKAESELGARFDIKAFNAALLEHGALPLTVLDRVVDEWIQDQRGGQDPGAASGIPPAVYTDPPHDLLYPARTQVLHIPTGGVQINGIAYLPPGTGLRPTAVFFLGLPGNEKNLDLLQAVRRAGWNAITFFYRGSWGSPGVFRFAQCPQDAAAVLTYLRTKPIADALGIDTTRIVIVGHSMGGWVAVETAAQDHHLAGVALISAADMSKDFPGDMPHAQLVKFLSGLMESYAGVTAEQMADELEAHANQWRFDRAYDRIGHVPVLVITADDRYAPTDGALVAALLGHRGQSVTPVHLDTDHVYSDHRIALEAVLIRWLQSLPQ